MIVDEDHLYPNDPLSQPSVAPEEPTCITYKKGTGPWKDVYIAENTCNRCLVVRVHQLHPQSGGVWRSHLLFFRAKGRLPVDEFNGGGIRVVYQKPCPNWAENI